MNPDIIVVLGTSPNKKNWRFPRQMNRCLNATYKLANKYPHSRIAVCGKWSIDFDNEGVRPPFKECEKLRDLLVLKGVSGERILIEDESKDSISNLYFLKSRILIPNHYTKVLFVLVNWRIARIKILVEKILGTEYKVEYKHVWGFKPIKHDEKRILKKQQEFLRQMKNGNHIWLKNKFYSASIYRK